MPFVALPPFNLGAIEHLDELQALAQLAVRALDEFTGLPGLPYPCRLPRQHEPPYFRYRRD